MTIRKIWVEYSNGEHDLTENLSIPLTLYADESYVTPNPDLLSHFTNIKGSTVTAVYIYANGTHHAEPYEGWFTTDAPTPGPDPRVITNIFNFLDGTTSIDLNSNNKITIRMYYLSEITNWTATTPVLGNE
jgi:hypothetical protein